MYFKYGARSNKKVNYFHSSIKKMLETYFSSANGFIIKLEYNIKSCNLNADNYNPSCSI